MFTRGFSYIASIASLDPGNTGNNDWLFYQPIQRSGSLLYPITWYYFMQTANEITRRTHYRDYQFPSLQSNRARPKSSGV